MYGESSGVTGDITVTTRQVKTIENEALFFPHCTQAPVLMFPEGKEIARSRLPSLHQILRPRQLFVSIPVPARVGAHRLPQRLRALPARHHQQRRAELLADPNRRPRSNNNSSSSSSSSSSSKRDPHRHGDLVRLTWSFADQSSGFRDYYGDVYGRRSYRRPAELGPHDTLCLKVPYPRFENPEEQGVGLVMSTALTQEGIVQSLWIRPLDGEGESVERTYNLHDLCWRLDPVGNGGVGDAGNFMNVVTDVHGAVESYMDGKVKLALTPPPPFSQRSPESVVAGVLLGPLAAPVLGVVSSAISSIFGF